ncbi:hypothetical protein HPB49_015883 [Dermacentor silvarum]|uniref:Uncharacterized protein n=1 Tax=Dermacentor silvarum TaxID=543639 RepID=A0ACB8E1D3_DERSI|nr:hypothetical protein HPB49_015883 [Dermacentor silvarum]
MSNTAVSTAWQPTAHAATIEYRSTPQTRGTMSYYDHDYDQRPRRTHVSRQPMPSHDECDPPAGYAIDSNTRDYMEEHRNVRPLPVCFQCGVAGHIARFCNRQLNGRTPPLGQLALLPATITGREAFGAARRHLTGA